MLKWILMPPAIAWLALDKMLDWAAALALKRTEDRAACKFGEPDAMPIGEFEFWLWDGTEAHELRIFVYEGDEDEQAALYRFLKAVSCGEFA